MIHSFLSFFIFAIIFNSCVRSQENLFLEVLNEVQPDLEELIAPTDRDQFYNDYYDASDLLKGFNIGELFNDLERGVHDNKTCHICNEVFKYGKMLLQTSEIVKVFAKSICKKANYYTERVCNGVLQRMADPVVYIIQNTKLTVPELCSTLLHPDCMTHLDKPLNKKVKWELSLPNISKRKQFKPKTGNEKQLKMVHLSDFHLDLYYTPGSNSQCNEPMCCRSTSYGNNRSAGYWSQTYGLCDTPIQFVESAVKHIKDAHKDIDFVIWTGDNVPHDVWNTSQTSNLKHIKTASDLVKHAFNDIKVFPCLGNHESHPINMYVPNQVSQNKTSNFSMSWLYDTLADDYWGQYINTETAKKTFKSGGYYSALVNDGLKVIVLNDNMCQRGNYWIAYDQYDPDGQLQWLINELDSAENKSIYAMIIGHVPPSDCYFSWTDNYIRIVERYQHLIVGTYFGHTHKDEIMVLYNKNRKNQTIPVSHGYIGSSITTFATVNPGYRIFTLDKTGKPLDFDMYYTNVTEDNIKGRNVVPKWERGYSAKDSYGLKSLSTESWDQFLTKGKTDDKLIKLYFKHFYRFSEAFEESNDLSIENQRQTLLNRRCVNPINELLKNDN